MRTLCQQDHEKNTSLQSPTYGHICHSLVNCIPGNVDGFRKEHVEEGRTDWERVAEKCNLNSEGRYLSISCQRTSTMNLRKHDRYHSLIYLVKCRLWILNLPYTRSGIDNALSVCIARLSDPFVEFTTMDCN